MIYGAAIFFVTFVIKMILDLSIYFSGKHNKHAVGSAIVFLVLVACSWITGWMSAPMWFFGWWALWDTTYALFIGQPFYYVGTVAWLDQVQRAYPFLIFVKYGGAILGIVLYIIKGG